MKITIYLAGPINACSDDQCIEWRNKVIDYYSDNKIIEIRDPMVRDYRDPKEAHEGFIEIVENDKSDILHSDILIINASNKETGFGNRPSVGTSMETLFAWQEGKSIVILCDDIETLSPWFKYHCDFIVDNWDDVFARVDDVIREIERTEAEFEALGLTDEQSI